MYAICHLSIVPLRDEASHKSEQISQLLYGELCFVIKEEEGWCYVRTDFDNYEGWIDAKQLSPISEATYEETKKILPRYASDMVDYVQISDKEYDLLPICIGATVSNAPFIGHLFSGEVQRKVLRKNVVEIALRYLNTPYLWGGKSPFGIDSSGFVQMVYKLMGIKLPRDMASQHEMIENDVPTLEDAEVGDLLFFNDNKGRIIHVGLLIQPSYIIHAYGKVRVDRITPEGIFDEDIQEITHNLYAIKRILDDDEKKIR